VREILKGPTQVAMATKFEKIGYNSACVGNITVKLAHSRGFSRSCYWMMSDKLCHDWLWLSWQRNLKHNQI